jgi:hypothetical protein
MSADRMADMGACDCLTVIWHVLAVAYCFEMLIVDARSGPDASDRLF